MQCYSICVGNKWGFNGEGRFAHSGMLRAAMWIRNDLNENPSARVADIMKKVTNMEAVQYDVWDTTTSKYIATVSP